jgi:hypothetical protein
MGVSRIAHLDHMLSSESGPTSQRQDGHRTGGAQQPWGTNVVTLEVEGRSGEVSITGGVEATGTRSVAVSIGDDADVDLEGIGIRSPE